MYRRSSCKNGNLGETFLHIKCEHGTNYITTQRTTTVASPWISAVHQSYDLYTPNLKPSLSGTNTFEPLPLT